MLSLLIWLIIATEVCGGLLKKFPTMQHAMTAPAVETPLERIFKKPDLPDTNRLSDDYFNTYYTVTDQNEALNVVSQVSQLDLDKISRVLNISRKTLLFVKTTRHRNKRYTSYLTLCPFKICNMGRKRTRTKLIN